MGDDMFFIVELEIGEGQVDELRSVMREMSSTVEADEPGTVGYEWYLTRDGGTCHIYERYDDAAAAVAHGNTLPEALNRRAQQFRPTRLTAYGALGEEVMRKRIEPLLAAVPDIIITYLDPLGGFAR
ncbi:MAG TPA: antibiotic biosynthesis monooxygenase [Acidimicrobiales bacterium]|nr:antibiotic biosynthesis monooxygenase [Acidimicrobiales bacterium]